MMSNDICDPCQDDQEEEQGTPEIDEVMDCHGRVTTWDTPTNVKNELHFHTMVKCRLQGWPERHLVLMAALLESTKNPILTFIVCEVEFPA